MQIRKVRKDGVNETGCLVVDSEGVPVDKICRYTLVELSGHADSTQENITRHIIHIETWAAQLGIDLETEVSLSGLNGGELFTSLLRHLERYSEKQSVVTPIVPRVVDPEYFNQRIDACVNYFDFLSGRAIGKRRAGDPMIRNIEVLSRRVRNRLKRRKRRVSASSDVQGLSPLMQATLYKGLSNPQYFGWTSRTALRNKLIIRLLYETGIRKGELLSLTIENCRTSKLAPGERPYIRTMENVKYEDPRTDIPHEKTRGRIIPISNDLAELIEEYKVIRSQPQAARKQKPFLILASKFPYLPLSTSALNGIFETIKKRIPGLEKFGPHRLRHTFFENLDRMMYREGYSDTQKKKIKNTIGGWAPTSNMSDQYEKLATMEQCVETLSKYHEELEASETTIMTSPM